METTSCATCDRPVKAKGYCQRHYRRWKQYGDPNGGKRQEKGLYAECRECGGPHFAAGYCINHYSRWKRHGDPNGGGPARMSHAEIVAFFYDNTGRQQDECVEWPKKYVAGYVQFQHEGRIVRAHVEACTLAHGPKPEPHMQANHRCGNPGCILGAHLYWGTHQQNMEDMKRHGRTRAGQVGLDYPWTKGERNPAARLTHEQVLDLRQRYAAGEKVRLIAESLGLHAETVSRAARGVTFPDLPGAVPRRSRGSAPMRCLLDTLVSRSFRLETLLSQEAGTP